MPYLDIDFQYSICISICNSKIMKGVILIKNTTALQKQWECWKPQVELKSEVCLLYGYLKRLELVHVKSIPECEHLFFSHFPILFYPKRMFHA